jgi:hypothetical protein
MASYVLGYGALLERASRTRTNPDAIGAWPARVTGYQRRSYSGSPKLYNTVPAVSATY